MPLSTDTATATKYEETICLIPGVMAARVNIENGQVVEAHVLGDTTRHPMQIVRDVESSLMARFGMRVDRKRISVAQIEKPVHTHPRLVLTGIFLSITGNEAEVRAELQWKDEKYQGVAKGVATSRSRLVLAAQAVLSATCQLMPAGVHFALETVDWVTVADERTILVLVSLFQGQRIQNLAGAAFIRRDETEAAGRATLAAVNRRLELFT